MTAAPAVGRPRFKRSAASSPARLERPTDALSTLPFRRPAMTPTPVLNRALERLHGSIAREVPFAHKSTPRGAVCATQAHVRAPRHSGATSRVPSSLVDGVPALPTFNASEPSAVIKRRRRSIGSFQSWLLVLPDPFKQDQGGCCTHHPTAQPNNEATNLLVEYS